MRGQEIIVDLFAGGGGASLGIELALGRPVDVAINHDELAVAMHAANHLRTAHHCKSVYAVSPVEAVEGRPVGLLWASPDCTHFSRAKGGCPVSPRVRDLAWVVVDWASWVRPRVICLENVSEFAQWGPLIPRCDGDGNPMIDVRTGEPILVPDPERKGETFREFVRQLQQLGYRVEWRTLNAADFGAPTSRKRLFLVARCDGAPIGWPTPTHGPGRPLPWRTAAECIDWSIPCPSIFDRKRPLAEKTLQRIARGIVRYVLEDSAPFIVQVNHGRDEFRGQPLDQPMPTITERHGFGLVAPTIARLCQNGGNGKYTNRPDEPLTTIVSKAEHCLVAPVLTSYHGLKGEESRARGLDEPAGTLDTSNRYGLVSAFLAKHFGGVVGQDLEAPLGTITARDHHSLVAAHVTKFQENSTGQSPGEPLHTVLAGAQRFGLVAAFLTKYYGQAVGQHLAEPLHTATGHARFGVVTVQIDGETYALADIGMRMLEPRELARAQGFPDNYILTGSKAAQVARIGNSVCPPVARALVEAQFGAEEARREVRA